MKRIVGASFALLAALVLAAACTAPVSNGNAASESGVTENGTADAHGSMNHGDMSQTASGDAFDLQFLDAMTAHHEGAVAMAEEAVTQAEHEEVKTLAEAIIAAQTDEIAQMAEWRQAWFPDAEQTPVDALPMGDMATSTDESLPFDQRFIEAMISHHEGAIAMAQSALEQSGHDEIRALAEAVVRDQQQEIDQMRGWLREWYGIEEE